MVKAGVGLRIDLNQSRYEWAIDPAEPEGYSPTITAWNAAHMRKRTSFNRNSRKRGTHAPSGRVPPTQASNGPCCGCR
jgi:hypothetical protein